MRAAAAAGALTASPLAHAPAPIVHGAQQRRMAQLDYRYLHDPADGSFDQNTSHTTSQPTQHRNRQSVALASTLCLSPRHATATATPAVNLVPAASVVSPAAAATGTGPAGAATGAATGTGAGTGKAFFNHVPPPPADAYSALLPKSAVPHITGNFISWGAPLPMIPLVRARAAAVAAARPSGHESSSSSSSPDAHADDADAAAAAGGEEGGDHDSGDGSPSSSPQAAAAPRVRIDAKFAGSSPAAGSSSSSASSSSSSNGLRSPRPQLLRGLDPSVGEEDVLSSADRDECIERGAYSIDLWMPPGAELLFRCADAGLSAMSLNLAFKHQWSKHCKHASVSAQQTN